MKYLPAVITMRDGHQVRLMWANLLRLAFLHVVCLLALLPVFFSWHAVGVFVVMWVISGLLGVTLGFHRLLTHRSFHTPKWVEYFLTICATIAWQGSPAHWVGIHRLHHADSDGPEDPHSPKDGFGWSHLFWMFYANHPGPVPASVALDLKRDKVHCFIERYWYVPQFIAAGVLYYLGGWSFVIWGIALRTVLLYHATWFVNSASHTWGYRNFATEDGSKNNWWVAVLSFGEGWHNNHHAQQRSAAHGMRWWELDITYLAILAMEQVGLAWEVVRPKRPVRKGREIVASGMPRVEGTAS